MKFLKIFQIFNWKTWKNGEKTNFFFRGRPASWKRSPDALNLFPDAISEGFLSFFYCRWNAFKNFAVRLGAGFRGGSGEGSLRCVLWVEIGFEYINLHHFIELVGVEHVRIDVESLFFEIGISRRSAKK